ncbi:hypothetical protein Tco_0955903 [Tanacetum coccineum]|uniref:Uncharacterized protein n=1 Tax=Tanacetum coccineum TaxID=301880 RepID=A0ABQ5E8H7_9ASTR
MLKTIIHAQTIQKRLDDKKLQIQECTVQEVKALDAISEDKAKRVAMVSFRTLLSHLKRLSTPRHSPSRKELESSLDSKRDLHHSLIYLDDEYVDMTCTKFLQFTRRKFQNPVNTLIGNGLLRIVRLRHTLDDSLVNTTRSRTKSKEQDTSSRLGNDTHADDANIRPIYDEEPMAENAEQCHDTCPLPAKLTDNQTNELSNQSLESENISLKEGQNGQFSKVKSTEAKIKHDIDVIETINIELEHKVDKLLKKNETLKRHYKELFDSIKITRAKTIEHTTSLIAKNDEFKAQLQEKGFAIAALKNELRKLTGNSVNTKFAKSSILGKPVLQPHRNQSVVRQPTAFKSERPRISKPRFASQVDVNNDLSKPVTTHYLPKERESAVAKPHHMIAPGSSRYSSNDMVHNHYLEEAKKKTQESGRNSRPSVMPSARSQSTANGSKPKPRINNQNSRNWPASKSSCVTTKTVPIAEHSRNSRNFSDSKHFVCSTCQKCVFNANHDHCVTKFLNEVNSRAKVPSNKTTNINKPVRQISVSIKKSSVVHEKTMTPRSYLRWKPTGKIFKTVGLRWVPTGKIFTSNTTTVDSDPKNCSNEDITNQYECEQTLDVNAGTLNLSTELGIHDHNNELSSSKLVLKVVPPSDKTATSRQELELLFHHLITMLSNEPSSSKLVPKVVPLAVKTATSRQVLELLFYHHIAMLRTTGDQFVCSKDLREPIDHEQFLSLRYILPEDPYVEAALQAPPSPDYVPGPEEPEQAPLSPDYVPGPEHADDDKIVDYPEEDDNKDLEEDPIDYPADGGDDGDDEMDIEEDEDNDMDINADELRDEDDGWMLRCLRRRRGAPSSAYPVETVPLPAWSDLRLLMPCLSFPTSITTIHGLHNQPRFSFTATPDTISIITTITPSLYAPPPCPHQPPNSLTTIVLPLQSYEGRPRPARGLRADYGFVATMDREIRRDPERYVGYGITDSWDEIVETLQGAPVSTDTELGAHVREFESMVRRDTDEIYTMLDDEQSQRQLLAGRVNMLFREAWGRSMDASDLARAEVMSLRTTVHAQMSEIRELQSADRSRQRAISDLLETDRGRREEMRELRAADRARQQQIIQTLTVMQTLQREMIPLQGLVTTLQGQVTALQGQVMALQGQVTALQGQQGPAGGPAQPELPEEAGSSS